MAALAVRCDWVAVEKKSQTGLTLFPFLRLYGAASQEMSVGYANGIRVMSMTHTGEPGFMLYIPIEVSLHLEAGTMVTVLADWRRPQRRHTASDGGSLL